MERLLSYLPVRIVPAPSLAEGEKTDRVVWFVVAIWILLALAATLIVGALIWCFINAHNSLYAVVQLNPWYFAVGCN